MSHQYHAKFLLDAIRDIDAHIVACVDDGSVPVLDAVETSKLLKALVSADLAYTPNIESATRRLARMQASASNPVARTCAHVISTGWVPRQKD